MLTFPGKIPIRIFPVFWFLAALIGWINSESLMGTVLWVIVIFFSVLLHEFGHALTSVAFGQTASIDLVAFGGLTQRSGPKIKLWKEFLVTFAGPFASILLSIGAYIVLQFMTKKQTATFYLVEITFLANLFWAVLNLLPIQPLDGGRLLSIFLEGILGLRGIKLALFLSLILSAGVSLLFFLFGDLLLGSLFLLLTYESYLAWKNSLGMTEQDQNSTLQEELKEVQLDLRKGKQNLAFSKLEQIRNEAQSGVIYITATEYMAELLYGRGKFQEVYDLLSPLKKQLNIQALKLLQNTTYQIGKLDEAISLGNRVYQESPGYDIALLNSLCFAQQGQAKPAVGWLETAVRDGLPNLKAVLSKSEFEGIRKTAPFIEFFQRHQKN